MYNNIKNIELLMDPTNNQTAQQLSNFKFIFKEIYTNTSIK